MLKTLLTLILLQMGWVDRQAPYWVQQADPQKLVHSLVIHQPEIPATLRSSLPSFPGAVWRRAAGKHGVDPLLLYSIALLESGKKADRNKVGPWPYALHFNEADVSIYASSVKEARYVLANVTTDNVDIGLGQVNYRSHKDKVKRPEELLDPEINLTVAGRILAEALNSTQDRELGVGRYHSRTEWRARAYGRKVLAIHRALQDLMERQASLSQPKPRG